MSTTRDRGRRAATRRHSATAAGGVVLRSGEHGLEAAIIGRNGTWVFPKGRPAPAESLEETARREVREETGLEVRIVRSAGAMSYSFTSPGGRVDKTVHFYVMEPVGGDVSLHDASHDEVRWVGVADARRMLSFEGYRAVLDRALGPRA